jgi:hypothetical protein
MLDLVQLGQGRVPQAPIHSGVAWATAPGARRQSRRPPRCARIGVRTKAAITGARVARAARADEQRLGNSRVKDVPKTSACSRIVLRKPAISVDKLKS